MALNISGQARPHVQASITRVPFADGVFQEIYFEKVSFEAFTGANGVAIKEAARVLQPGGRLRIESGLLAPVAEVRALLRQAGFTHVRVTRKVFLRIAARLGGQQR